MSFDFFINFIKKNVNSVFNILNQIYTIYKKKEVWGYLGKYNFKINISIIK